MSHIFKTLLIILIAHQGVLAQFHKKYQKHGDNLMSLGNYSAAVKNYRIAMGVDSTDASLNYAYAQGLRLTNNYKKAAHYYKRTQRLSGGRSFTLTSHYAGDMYKYLGEYSKSQKEHSRFLNKYKGDKKRYEYQRSVFEIAHSRDLIHLLNDTSDLVLDNNHPVNTGYSEFGAFIADEKNMIYSALRSDSLKNRLVLDSNSYYSRIYLAEYKDKWMTSGTHPSFHENERVHIANAVYSPKQDYVYYSECEGRNCKIFKARRNGNEWMDFQLLPESINLPGYTNSQPFIERIDGYDILYFVSDRPGGYGKLDIWYTIAYSTGEFENPINLGDSINSPGNDICPFYMDEENALYFSSDWYCGLGGFDIFRSQAEGEKFRRPENLGLPFNSSYNDLYFRYFDGQAVLTSNRIGSLTDKFENCCNDLFFFSYEPKSIPTVHEMTGIERIEKLLPLRLYFHNDEPNPRSQDTSTSVLYSASYIQYITKESQYKREYARGLGKRAKESANEEIEQFFTNYVRLGYEDLKEAMVLLEKELENGTEIELSIKGFASPLSFADYNRRLTLRRIAAVENELRHFKRGTLSGYIENGQLRIKRYPFGEDRISDKVSDDSNDKRNAIYSKRASFERRVEIIAVKRVN